MSRIVSDYSAYSADPNVILRDQMKDKAAKARQAAKEAAQADWMEAKLDELYHEFGLVKNNSPLRSCNRCGQSKPLSAFSVGADGRRNHVCRMCVAEMEIRDAESAIRGVDRAVSDLGRYKLCPHCGVTRHISQFYACKASPDGHKSTCKICCSIAEKAYYARKSAKAK